MAKKGGFKAVNGPALKSCIASGKTPQQCMKSLAKGKGKSKGK